MNNNTPSSMPSDGNGGTPPGGSSSSSFSGTRSAATTLSESASLSSQSYSSTSAAENALLVTSGEITLENPTVSKSGDESSEDSDFYGTNAAVIATDGTLTIEGGSIETSGSHANALFAYGSGKIIAKDLKITTSKNNSGGIMVTGGGTLSATDLSVETSGNSSAAIRSDRGGGTMTVKGGSYKTSGVGSPAIYSTAEISVSDGATLTSTSSEGVVIEGSNSVSLSGVTLTDTNNSLNGNSETYKNIFIYQSMSGDAEEGTGTFSATNSKIITNQGDTFFITNTTAKITLSGNLFINNDSTGAFLRAGSGKWGTSGKNGGIVDLTLNNQVVEGDIVLDSLSSLTLTLSNDSHYMGVINGENTASSVSVSLSSDSNLVLAGDSYLTSLENADSKNSNIYSNGYTLYVAGKEVSINSGTAPETPEVTLSESSETSTEAIGASTSEEASSTSVSSSPNLTLIISLSVCGVLLLGLIIFAILKLRKKTPATPERAPDLSTPNPFTSSNTSRPSNSSSPSNTTPSNPPSSNPFTPKTPPQTPQN